MNTNHGFRHVLRQFRRVALLSGLAALGIMLLGVLVVVARGDSGRMTSMVVAILFAGVVSTLIRLAHVVCHVALEGASFGRRAVY
jgi:hypothetical protein